EDRSITGTAGVTRVTVSKAKHPFERRRELHHRPGRPRPSMIDRLLPHRSRLFRVVGAAAVVLALTACGDDDATSDATSDTTAPVNQVVGEVTVADAWSRQPAAGQ